MTATGLHRDNVQKAAKETECADSSQSPSCSSVGIMNRILFSYGVFEIGRHPFLTHSCVCRMRWLVTITGGGLAVP